MNTHLKSALMAVCAVALVACGGRRLEVAEPAPVPLSQEEQRLLDCSRLDSVSLWTLADSAAMPGRDGLDTLTAEAWILVEASRGLVISEKNADQRMYPASLTKMMTCLLALEHGHLDDTIRLTRDVFVTTDCHVRPGDSYVARDLLNEMMLLSDNVAAYALAAHAAGDTLAFFDMMNRKADYLGMKATHFANANGMPNDSNYSTARDLLRLARYAMCDTLFASIVGTPFLDIPLTDGRHQPCKNTNVLLENYEGCFGIKTGYTRKAGACLASAATRDGITLYLILLKSRNYATRFPESALLLDYGFSVIDGYRWRQLLMGPVLQAMEGLRCLRR